MVTGIHPSARRTSRGACGGHGACDGRNGRDGTSLGRPLPHRAVAALLLIALLSATVQGCTAGRAQGCVGLTVAAAAELASVVQAAAGRFGGAEGQGGCVRVKVEGRDPAGLAADLAGGPGRGGAGGDAARVDAWIPDSSLWIPPARRTRAGARDVAGTGVSIASSPVVWATTAAQARDWEDEGIEARWRSLVPEASIAQLGLGRTAGSRSLPLVPDPAVNAEGMAAVLAAHRLAGQEERGLVRLALAMTQLRFLAVHGIDDAFAAMTRDRRRPVPGVTSEQSIVGLNRGAGARRVVARYPAEGTYDLDYPYVITTRDRDKAKAAAAFGVALRDRRTIADLQAKGFRAPDGTAGPVLGPRTGTSATPPRRLPPPDAATVLKLRDMWSRAMTGARALTVLDVSAEMKQKTTGTDLTRLQASTEWLRQQVELSPDPAEIGFWEFGRRLDGSLDRREVVPIRRLDTGGGRTTQRERLVQAVGSSRTERGPGRGLLDTVLTSFRAMQRDYRPGRYNFIQILTTGVDTEPGTEGVRLDQLIGLLQQENDPTQPIEFVFGVHDPKADLAPLRAIVERTGGKVYSVQDLQFPDAVQCDLLLRTLCTGSACP